MEPIKQEQIRDCDKESQIYCKAFNDLRHQFNENEDELSDGDLAYLGLYLCKCIEQEINSTVVQLMRQILGVKMPDYYCRPDPNVKRGTISVRTDFKIIPLNDWRDREHREILKPIPLGESYWALTKMLDLYPFLRQEHPVLDNSKFKEAWRNIAKLRNEIAHAGTIIRRQILLECYGYCQMFLQDFMPDLAKIKKALAPDGGTSSDDYGYIVGVKSLDETLLTEVCACGQDSRINDLFQDSIWEVSWAELPEGYDDNTLAVIQSEVETIDEIEKATADTYYKWLFLTYKARSEAKSGNNDDASDTLDLRDEYESLHDWSDVIYRCNGKYGLKDILGEIVVPAVYDGFRDLQSYLHHDHVSFAVKDGKVGLVERYTGIEITEFIFDSLHRMPVICDWFFFQKDGSRSYGILNDYGAILVPAIIDSHYEIVSDSGVAYESGGLYGYMSHGYDLCISPIYDDIIFEDYDEPLVFVRDGESGHVDKDGIFYPMDVYEQLREEDRVDYGFISEISDW